jgi:hypothetical protein
VLPGTSRALYHRVRVADPDLFKAEYGGRGIVTKTFSEAKGIKGLLGLLKEPGPRGGMTQVQSYLFDATKYTIGDAIAWVKAESPHRPLMATEAPVKATERRPAKLRKKAAKRKARIPKKAAAKKKKASKKPRKRKRKTA